ncbi:hypothetical protein PISMIDRAFT_11846 [Pisolithus microcarpus 441]|uniref:DUF6532 domain-containing protein n=1 Tax=Pisolithus microcarpus 441 TaxID=765257 RepID=A0A0C9ZI08_9AGAM|nr:hypothetical protein BKA83DRAFT_11846 [Pisolithus microcarpus]KIK22142.1 hypothetical protein PISMIDRAFT_11846 [Pisolithus microcarpus 441]
MVRPVPYNADLRHVGLVERPLRPGELVPNEAFVIPGRSAVIQQVGETTRSVGRNLSAVRLPPAYTGASNTIDKQMASEIKVDARTIFKHLLFSQNLLPDSDDLVTMIREALHSAASSHSQAGVNEWVKKNVSSETKRLRDIAINVHNDFKDIACILAPSLYNLTLPIRLRGHEVPFRQQEILALLENFSWIDETHHLDDGSVSQVPFSHPAVIQVVIILLWGEKNYWRFIDVEHKNINPTVVFTGIVLQQALQEYSTGIFSPQELNARASRSSYDSLHSRLLSLRGGELERYNLLVDDLFTRGDEMLGKS